LPDTFFLIDIYPGISYLSVDTLSFDCNTLLTDTFSSRLERVLIRREVSAEAKDISEGRVSSKRRVSVKGEQYELREDIH